MPYCWVPWVLCCRRVSSGQLRTLSSLRPTRKCPIVGCLVLCVVVAILRVNFRHHRGWAPLRNILLLGALYYVLLSRIFPVNFGDHRGLAPLGNVLFFVRKYVGYGHLYEYLKWWKLFFRSVSSIGLVFCYNESGNAPLRMQKMKKL